MGRMRRRDRKGTYKEIIVWKWAGEKAGVLDGLLKSWGEGGWHLALVLLRPVSSMLL